MADGSVIIDTALDNSGIERDLKDIKRQAAKTGDAVEDYGEEFDNAAKKSRESKSNVEKDLDDIKGSLDAIKGALSVGFFADFATGLIDTTNELSGDLSMLQQNAQNAGVGLGVTEQAFQRLNTVSGEADSSVEAVSNLLAAGVPENKMLDAVDGLSNAVITFPDTLKIESLADSLQETLATGTATGQFGELLDRLGIGAENFTNNLQGITDESDRLDYALSILNSGSLKGVYDGWAEANPELVEGRDATLEMQQAMADLAEEIRPIVTDITEMATGIAGWVSHNVDIENLFEVIVAGVTAVAGVRAIETIKSLYLMISQMGTAAALAQAQSILLFAGIGLIALAAQELMGAWDDMTGMERAIAILGLVAAAAFTAAIAVGAFQSAATLGIAALAIAAGIAAVMVAVNNAQSRAEAQARKASQFTIQDYSPNMMSSGGIPQLATGAVIPPNRRFMAVLGDQRNGTNLEAPEGLIRQIVREESGGVNGTLRISPAPGLTRYLKYELEVEGNRAGTPLVQGVRR